MSHSENVTQVAPVVSGLLTGRRFGATVAQVAALPGAAKVGLFLLGLIFASSVLAPWLTPWDPLELSSNVLLPPDSSHLFGTDDLGRDILSRALYAGRTTLILGGFAALVAVLIGVTVGLCAGFFSGVVDDILMRVTEVFQIVPKLLAAIVVVALIGGSTLNVILVLGLLSWPPVARVIRAQVLVIRQEEFISAAIMSGATYGRVIARHILPNVVPFLVVSACLQVASAILSESALSFLGLGDPGNPSWGLMLQQSQSFLRQAWWMSVFPGVMLAATVLGLNLLGDGVAALHQGRTSIGSRPAMAKSDVQAADGKVAETLLDISDLTIAFEGVSGRRSNPVNGVNLRIGSGDMVGIVGESGSGKSLTVRSALGLVPEAATTSGRVLLDGRNVLAMSEHQLEDMRGRAASMVFQDPMTAFNPVRSIQSQIREAINIHSNLPRAELDQKVGDLLSSVGVRNISEESYPHEFSGGMRQRSLIAMSVANDPKLLVADEPTTALDATVQDQVLGLIRDLNQKHGTAVLLVTHNIAIVASLCRRVVVMYAGQVVEDGPVDVILREPEHPYTWMLLRSMPAAAERGKPLTQIEGQPPDPFALPPGCKFHQRCPFAQPKCMSADPELATAADGRRDVRCHYPMSTRGLVS